MFASFHPQIDVKGIDQEMKDCADLCHCWGAQAAVDHALPCCCVIAEKIHMTTTQRFSACKQQQAFSARISLKCIAYERKREAKEGTHLHRGR